MARTRICMEGLKYLRPIWQLNYILQQIHITMKNTVAKLIVNLKHLRKEMTGISFISYLKDIMNETYLIFLLAAPRGRLTLNEERLWLYRGASFCAFRTCPEQTIQSMCASLNITAFDHCT